MGYIIGIDVGGSTTKTVGFNNGQITSPLFVKANDPLASLYGAFGRFVAENKIDLAEIDKVMVTGVGASFVKDSIYGISTSFVREFTAIGLGGLFLSGLDSAIIVSMGTGTAIVRAEGEKTRHLGGSGVGGGTLLGLSKGMLQINDFDDIIETAQGGDLGRVDLLIKDITKGSVSYLSPTATASNFGKLSDLANKSDIALGIINMVFQTVGMMAVFAVRSDDSNKVVLTGSLTKIPQIKNIFSALSDVSAVEFILPANAEFATAAGAALAYIKDAPYENI